MKEKVKKPIYKRWWVWLIAVVIVGTIGLIEDEGAEGERTVYVQSDVDSENVSEDEPEEVEPEDEEEQTEFTVGEPIDFEDRIVEVTDVEYSNGNDFDKPSEGKEYVIVTVSITNNSDEEVSYGSYHFKMRNSNGQIEDQSFTIVDSDTALSTGDLAAGGNVTGTLAFEQPIDDGELTLIFEPEFWSDKKVEIALD